MKMDVKCCVLEARVKADADQLESCSAVMALGPLESLGIPQGSSRPEEGVSYPGLNQEG